MSMIAYMNSKRQHRVLGSSLSLGFSSDMGSGLAVVSVS